MGQERPKIDSTFSESEPTLLSLNLRLKDSRIVRKRASVISACGTQLGATGFLWLPKIVQGGATVENCINRG